MEQGRKRIEEFMRRDGLGQNRVLRVLTVAVAILVVLQALRVLRALPRAIGAIGAGAIGAILVLVAWLLLSSGTALEPSAANFPIPGPADGPVVKNGVAVIVACGKKRGFMETVDSAPEPQTGTWSPVRRGDCTVWYHHPTSGD